MLNGQVYIFRPISSDTPPMMAEFPVSCNVCPTFQRRHTSLFCSAESPNRFPGFINTAF